AGASAATRRLATSAFIAVLISPSLSVLPAGPRCGGIHQPSLLPLYTQERPFTSYPRRIRFQRPGRGCTTPSKPTLDARFLCPAFPGWLMETAFQVFENIILKAKSTFRFPPAPLMSPTLASRGLRSGV